MRAAYVDTSCLVSVALAEARSGTVLRSLQSFDVLLASNLLEAELRAALLRENVEAELSTFLSAISWVHPDRPLTSEITLVLDTGYVRGADLWHLAVALFIDPDREIGFLTLDERQQAISDQLGFGGT